MKDLTTAVAGQHVLALEIEACRSRLAELAACCRPSALRRSAEAVVHWLRKGQLGPGYTCC
jgi:hypothetical protein